MMNVCPTAEQPKLAFLLLRPLGIRRRSWHRTDVRSFKGDLAVLSILFIWAIAPYLHVDGI